MVFRHNRHRTGLTLFLTAVYSFFIVSTTVINEIGDTASYKTVERGRPNTVEHAVFIKGDDKFVSGWHDVPLYVKAPNIYNMIVEIPRWTNAKMEMATQEPMAPIRHSLSKNDNSPRFVANVYPNHGYIGNYGALPQTWEDPYFVDPHTNFTGDGDPIDVLEIGSKSHSIGSVIQVKILGILGLIDDGETDWKLIAIDASDPFADRLNDISDVVNNLPGVLMSIREWFRVYKIPNGGKRNVFAFEGEFRDAAFAAQTIERTHQAWRKLIHDPNPPFNTECHIPGAAFVADVARWAEAVEQTPEIGAPVEPPSIVNEWYYDKKLMTDAISVSCRDKDLNILKNDRRDVEIINVMICIIGLIGIIIIIVMMIMR